MDYKTDIKLNLEEVKIVRILLELELNKNKLIIESMDEIEYNDLLLDLLEKVQIGEINILEDSLE